MAQRRGARGGLCAPRRSHPGRAAHRSTFDSPVCVDFRGVKAWEMPPSGQGLVALLDTWVERVVHEALALGESPR